MTTTASATATKNPTRRTASVLQPPPLTTHEVLFGPANETDRNPLEDSLRKQRVFEAVSIAVEGAEAGVMQAVRAEILRRADEMLSAPVVDRLVMAWRSYEELLDAARATIAEPGASRVVDLASTRTTSTRTWTVDVIVGVPRISIDFTLTVVFTLHTAAATVIGGRITKLGDGWCDIDATFTALGNELARHDERIDLYDHLSFVPGLLLVDSPPVPEPQRAAAHQTAR